MIKQITQACYQDEYLVLKDEITLVVKKSFLNLGSAFKEPQRSTCYNNPVLWGKVIKLHECTIYFLNHQSNFIFNSMYPPGDKLNSFLPGNHPMCDSTDQASTGLSL